MTGTLRCYSFHSVKGGVGKSTLSVVTALALAHKHPGAAVFLVDMDLTGTSLADVLPLEAPKWEGVEAAGPLDLQVPASGFHEHESARARIEERAEAEGSAAVGVPFLNDYLLYSTPDWDQGTDVPPAAISWRLQGAPDNLRVLPSSALPRDLVRALPVIYDEEHAAYLEGRLEYLLAALVSKEPETFVVFDTPPTIPGLSRSVLSLALRLSHEPKEKLSDDEDMPPALEAATVNWRAYLVATQDYQDIRAAARWLSLTEDGAVVRLVLNRVGGEKKQREQLHLRALREPGPSERALRPEDPEALARLDRRLAEPIWIEEHPDLQKLFRGGETLPNLVDYLRLMDEG